MLALRFPYRPLWRAMAAIAAVGALASPTTASATAGVHGSTTGPLIAAHGPLIADAGPLAARLVDANANYAGVGVDGNGMLSLQTNASANVSYYSTQWRRTVCGIKHFALYYDAGESAGLAVDGAGIFVEQYALSYRSGGKRYIVQAIDAAQIAVFTDADGVSRDMVYFRERVRVRRAKKGAKWCAGTHKKAFVGYRITQGA